MYYGKTTKKLEQLYAEYNKIWGCDPDCYEELEYGENAYKEFMKFIRLLTMNFNIHKCQKTNCFFQKGR